MCKVISFFWELVFYYLLLQIVLNLIYFFQLILLLFAAAVVLNEKNISILKQFGVTDSKKLTPKRRKLLLPKILLLSSDYGIGQSSAREIDKLGIRCATELSMIRALKKLKEKPSELIIDGPLLLRPWEGIQKNIIS